MSYWSCSSVNPATTATVVGAGPLWSGRQWGGRQTGGRERTPGSTSRSCLWTGPITEGKDKKGDGVWADKTRETERCLQRRAEGDRGGLPTKTGQSEPHPPEPRKMESHSGEDGGPHLAALPDAWGERGAYLAGVRGPRGPAETTPAREIHGRAGGAPPAGVGNAGVHPQSPGVINNSNSCLIESFEKLCFRATLKRRQNFFYAYWSGCTESFQQQLQLLLSNVG